MSYKITALPRDKWKGTVIPIGYTTDRYFDVHVAQATDLNGKIGFDVSLREQIVDPPITHTPEEYDFPDRLYESHWKDAFAWGIVEDGKLLAVIETCPEEWSNRLRITELWVHESLRRKGVGHALIELAKEQARTERRRALILETQSCNYNAIGFYLHEGFTLIGFDSCCYANNDLLRKEVRLEFGMLFKEPQKTDSRTV